MREAASRHYIAIQAEADDEDFVVDIAISCEGKVKLVIRGDD